MVGTLEYLFVIIIISGELWPFKAGLAEAYLVVYFNEIPDGIRYM